MTEQNERSLLQLFRVLGLKFYELQTGFAAIYMLCESNHIFSEQQFLDLKARVQQSAEMLKLREFLDRLSNPMEQVDFEKLLQEFEGPVQ